jgi:hypothetical protein
MRVLNGREASIAACVCDAIVAPGDVLPPVAQTDAIAALDETLAAGPAAGRIGLRALLLGVELAPYALGERARLRRLPAGRRAAVIARLRRGPLAGVMEALTAVLAFSYFGDAAVSRRLGYDAAANAARGRALRDAEGRW